MKTVAIIQARMGSTRLPGKSLMNIDGRPIINYVFDRVSNSVLIDEVWLATTTNAEDNVLERWAQDQNIKYFRGSSDDVLDRYYQTALLSGANTVIRITGDCPLVDPRVIDMVLGEYQKGGFDYVCNTQPPTFPDGLDVEVFSFVSLEKTWKEAKLKSEREHVTPYIWKNSTI
ncbi:MAG: glycosyltransferase family protein, partial [Candidatus Magasanikbacteria bacterium]|nr:glycosyltransferase family protein [Candidatus Magasanikbacteria bacterium]